MFSEESPSQVPPPASRREKDRMRAHPSRPGRLRADGYSLSLSLPHVHVGEGTWEGPPLDDDWPICGHSSAAPRERSARPAPGQRLVQEAHWYRARPIGARGGRATRRTGSSTLPRAAAMRAGGETWSSSMFLYPMAAKALVMNR